MTFSDLGLSDELLRAVADAGYTEPTPIQKQAIPVLLTGRDILGCAQTGTGKTAAFVLPILDILGSGRAKARMPRCLILEPTRELAAQVADNFDIYGKYHRLSKALLIGGVSLDIQIRDLNRGPDVLVATPGRLLDLFGRGQLLLTDVRFLVIDESDRMLDMGFMPDVERILALLPRMRTTLLFSATMPPEIRRLADSVLVNPKEIWADPPATAAETVTQGLVMVNATGGGQPGAWQQEKRAILRRLIDSEDVKNALIFCNRKRDVGVLARSLERHGYSAAQLHGDMPQPARMETLERFKQGGIKLLVCSNVAARGLDIERMSHVFSFDVPTYAEDYVHRIGRTGRAGRPGRAFTLATPEESKYLDAIARLTGTRIPRVSLDDAKNDRVESPPPKESRARPDRGRRPDNDGAKRPSPTRSRKRRKTRPSGGEDGGLESNVPVTGMGEHVPAFLVRTSRTPRKS